MIYVVNMPDHKSVGRVSEKRISELLPQKHHRIISTANPNKWGQGVSLVCMYDRSGYIRVALREGCTGKPQNNGKLVPRLSVILSQQMGLREINDAVFIAVNTRCKRSTAIRSNRRLVFQTKRLIFYVTLSTITLLKTDGIQSTDYLAELDKCVFFLQCYSHHSYLLNFCYYFTILWLKKDKRF